MHVTSFSKVEEFRDEYLSAKDKLEIADICGLSDDVSSAFIFSEDNWNHIEIGVDRFGILNKDIEDESVDVIVIGQTLERVSYFWVLLSEIERVLKAGGYLCVIVSSSGAFGSRGDSYRFHPDSLISLAELIDFSVIECKIDPMNLWRDATLIARK